MKLEKLIVIEKEKSNIVHQLCKIYGVGPKKAIELSKQVTSIDELKQRQELLNDTQKIGLKYFDDIQERIPRKEIDEYNEIFQNEGKTLSNDQLKLLGVIVVVLCLLVI